MPFHWQYQASPYHFVKYILPPGAPLYPWLFKRLPNGFWDDHQNINAFFDFLSQNPDWQNVAALQNDYSHDSFDELLSTVGGQTLFVHYYENRREKFLKRLEASLSGQKHP